MIKKRRVSYVSIWLLALIILIVNEPLLSRIIGGAGILFLMACYLVSIINNLIRNGVVLRNIVLLISIYIGLELIYELLGISQSDSIYYFYTISFFFFIIAIPPIINDMTKQQKKIITATVIISIVIAMISNHLLLLQYGDMYIRLADFNTRTNAVSTQYISALVLFCGILFVRLKYVKKHRLATIILLAYSSYFIIYVGQRMIATVLLFATLLLQVVYNGKRTLRKYIIYTILVLIVAVLLMNYEIVLNAVADLIGNNRLTIRINQMLRAITTGDIQAAGGSLTVRYNLLMNSIHTFTDSFSNFLFGIGEHRNSNMQIGHHSQWADQLGKYGIFGTGLIIYVLVKSFKLCRKSFKLSKDNVLYAQYMILIIYFVIRGILGHVLYPYFSIQLFVFLPIVFSQIMSSQNIYVEEKKDGSINM